MPTRTASSQVCCGICHHYLLLVLALLLLFANCQVSKFQDAGLHLIGMQVQRQQQHFQQQQY